MTKWLITLCTAAIFTSVGCDKTSQIANTLQTHLSAQTMQNGKKIDIAEWQEEVRLFDGRTIIVSRKATAYSRGFPNATRGSDISTEFYYEPMKISWKHEMSETSVRHPMSFEIINGVAYLVLYVGDSAPLFCTGKPPTQYLGQFLKWSGGTWIEVAQVDFYSDKALLNLSSDYWGNTTKDDAKGLIPWDGKRTGGNSGETVKSFFEGYHRVCSLHQKQ